MVKVNLDGPEAFGQGATSVFAELYALAAALRADDETGSRGSIDALNARMNTVSAAQTAAGTRYQRLEQAQLAADDAELSLKNHLSHVETVDPAEATVELQLQEVAYQAALAASSRVMQPILLDFLR